MSRYRRGATSRVELDATGVADRTSVRLECESPAPLEVRAKLDATDNQLQDLRAVIELTYGDDGSQFTEDVPLRYRGVVATRVATFMQARLRIDTASAFAGAVGRMSIHVAPADAIPGTQLQRAEATVIGPGLSEDINVPAFAEIARIRADTASAQNYEFRDPGGALLYRALSSVAGAFAQMQVPERATTLRVNNTGAATVRYLVGWEVR